MAPGICTIAFVVVFVPAPGVELGLLDIVGDDGSARFLMEGPGAVHDRPGGWVHGLHGCYTHPPCFTMVAVGHVVPWTAKGGQADALQSPTAVTQVACCHGRPSRGINTFPGLPLAVVFGCQLLLGPHPSVLRPCPHHLVRPPPFRTRPRRVPLCTPRRAVHRAVLSAPCGRGCPG